MKVICFTMSYWDDEVQAQKAGELLLPWKKTVDKWLKPVHRFVSCGTWSEPSLSPLGADVPIINAGAVKDRPYDVIWHNYSGCAYGAAFHYALTMNYWDLIAILDTETLIGNVDFDAVLNEFLKRPEIHLNQDWHGRPGGPLQVWKREGLSRWLNYRQRANFIPKPEPVEGVEPEPPMLLEDEMGIIYKDLWWNPWPEFPTLRQDCGEDSEKYVTPEETLKWPFIRKPHPSIVERYLAEQTPLARPVKDA